MAGPSLAADAAIGVQATGGTGEEHAMRSIRSRLAVLNPVLIAVVAAGLIREGQKWV